MKFQDGSPARGKEKPLAATQMGLPAWGKVLGEKMDTRQQHVLAGCSAFCEDGQRELQLFSLEKT